MPGYPWLAKSAGRRRRRSGAKMRTLRTLGAAVHRRGDRQGARGAEGQDGAGRADRVPAGHGHRDEEREVADGARSIFLSSVMTVVSFVTFIGIVFWAYSRKRKRAFDDAANAPFALPDDAATRNPTRSAGGAHHERLYVRLLEHLGHRLTILSIVGCAWLLVSTGKIKVASEAGARRRRQGRGRRHRPRLGRRPAGVQQPAAEVVVQPVLDHDRLRRRVPRSSIRGSGTFPGVLKWSSSGAFNEGARAVRRAVKPLYEKYAKMDVEQIAADPAARADGRAHVPHVLLAVPRLRRRRQQGLSEPARQGLAVRRRAGRRSSRRSPAGAWA